MAPIHLSPEKAEIIVMAWRVVAYIISYAQKKIQSQFTLLLEVLIDRILQHTPSHLEIGGWNNNLKA